MNWKESILFLENEIRSLYERVDRLNERNLERIKILYEVRSILEKEFDQVGKERVLISESERISRAVGILRNHTPNGPMGKID